MPCRHGPPGFHRRFRRPKSNSLGWLMPIVRGSVFGPMICPGLRRARTGSVTLRRWLCRLGPGCQRGWSLNLRPPKSIAVVRWRNRYRSHLGQLARRILPIRANSRRSSNTIPMVSSDAALRLTRKHGTFRGPKSMRRQLRDSPDSRRLFRKQYVEQHTRLWRADYAVRTYELQLFHRAKTEEQLQEC